MSRSHEHRTSGEHGGGEENHATSTEYIVATATQGRTDDSTANCSRYYTFILKIREKVEDTTETEPAYRVVAEEEATDGGAERE
ncbi:hypothetical protein GQ600_1216 [Phytophthora cactorum]|nr:hypothetical protein GQ600_1216 [Phytophthora cactorum]